MSDNSILDFTRMPPVCRSCTSPKDYEKYYTKVKKTKKVDDSVLSSYSYYAFEEIQGSITVMRFDKKLDCYICNKEHIDPNTKKIIGPILGVSLDHKWWLTPCPNCNIGLPTKSDDEKDGKVDVTCKLCGTKFNNQKQIEKYNRRMKSKKPKPEKSGE